MHELVHQGFHVVFLLAFLAAIGLTFATVVLPVVSGERPRMDRWTFVIAGTAAAGLALDWLWHRLGW